MDGPTIVVGLAGVLATAAPIVVAAIGETFAERSGVINLSVNGSILLSAMGSFAVAVTTGSLVARLHHRGGDRGGGRPHRGVRQHHAAAVAGGDRLRPHALLPGPFLLPGQPVHGRKGAAACRASHPRPGEDPHPRHPVLQARHHDLLQLRPDRRGLVVDLPHPARADPAGGGRTPGGGLRPRGPGQRAPIRLHDARRSAGGPGRARCSPSA